MNPLVLSRGSGLLIRRQHIKLARGFLVEKSAFAGVAAAPVFQLPRDPKEFSRSHAPLARSIPVQVSSPQDDDPDIVRVGVGPRVKAGHELGKRPVRPDLRVPPENPHGNPWNQFLVGDIIRGPKDEFFLFSLLLFAPP